ncbi:ABC transporter ATP-binding protein [Streptomyces sp. NPDC053048]|uniref:ABC transporter ATP-binding protein n=1 Tax=Streptomyces sp. NPDC053048 TaxID=3365694 RepID=UPI0037D38589
MSDAKPAAAPSTLEAAQQRTAELFVQLCGDPDNKEIAAAADKALHQLDELLAAH